MKIMEALRILLISIFWIFNKYATGSSSTTEDTTSGSMGFSCAGKVIGGYYADVLEKCQMFHVCTIGENGEIRDIVFRCLNGTVFDQETRVCEREEEVNCGLARSFFHLNNDLYGPGIIPETAMDPVEARTPTTQQQVLDPSDALMGVMATQGSPLSPDAPSSHGAEAPDKPNTELTNSSTPDTSNKEKLVSLKTNRTSTTADIAIITATTTTTTTATADTTIPILSPFVKLNVSPSQSDRKSVSLPLDILKTNPLKKFTRPNTDLDNRDHDSTTNSNDSNNNTNNNNNNNNKNNSNNNNNNNNRTTPLIITRTASSTSVSASARVHIQTPLSRFSLRQGTDPSHTPLPAPHLRPSLLKLAAQSMSKAKERKSRRIKRGTKENDVNNSLVSPSNTNRLFSPRHHPFLPISVLYNPLSFILKPQILQPSTFTLNNQQISGSDIFEPRFRNALKHALGQTHRQITVLKSDKETTTRDPNSLCSGITNAASLVVDVEGGCQFLHLCLPQQNQGYAVQTFICGDKSHVFDPMTKLCTKRQSIQCNAIHSSSTPSFREAQFFSTYLLNLCPLFPHGSLMVDSLSGCEQYFQCPSMQNSNEPIVVRRCPQGYLFSQVDQICVLANSMVCSRDLFSLLKMFELKSSGLLKDNTFNQINIKSLGKVKKSQSNIKSNLVIPLVSRKKRAFSFEDRNFHRELASGSLTNAAGIFSDHVSVIEAQGPGNVLEGKINNPKFPLRDDQTGNNSNQPANELDSRYKKGKGVAPETSLELNKTVLNGTTIEVSKIASAKNTGEVTITSIVPKLNRHNGNGHKTERSDDEVSSPNPTIISNGKTKITLLGSSHSKSEENKDSETIIEQPDPTNSTLDSQVTDKTERDTSIQTEVPENSEAESVTDMITDAVPSETTMVDIITTEKPQEQTTMLTTVTTTTTTTPPPTTTTTTTTTTATTTTTSTTTTTLSTTSVQPESSTKEEKVETNFTCKDKELEQFYPDIEKDCKLFHYCSPGFSENEVLDLTFVCSNDTRFDIRTNKCQDMSTVICGEPIPTTTTAAPTTTSTTTSEAPSSSTETTVSSSTATAATSSTSTLESTTTSSEQLVSSSTNVQTVSESVEDSTMALASSSEGLELSGMSTVSEDPKSDSTESIIPDEEGSTISGDMKSDSDSKVTDSGTEKRSPSDGITSDILSSDSSIITEVVTEGSEKDQEISSTETSLVSDPTETTIIESSVSIIASSDDSKIKNNEESSTITPDEKVSENISSLGSATERTPEGAEISNLDSGTSTK